MPKTYQVVFRGLQRVYQTVVIEAENEDQAADLGWAALRRGEIVLEDCDGMTFDEEVWDVHS